MADGGICTQKGSALCVSCCRTSDADGYAAFIKTLKQYVCSNSPCSGPCSDLCTKDDITPLCATCVAAPPIATSVVVEVKNNCKTFGGTDGPLCVAWASCVEGCMQ